jgi:hypothetical protein
MQRKRKVNIYNDSKLSSYIVDGLCCIIVHKGDVYENGRVEPTLGYRLWALKFWNRNHRSLWQLSSTAEIFIYRVYGQYCSRSFRQHACPVCSGVFELSLLL